MASGDDCNDTASFMILPDLVQMEIVKDDCWRIVFRRSTAHEHANNEFGLYAVITFIILWCRRAA
jgi:hypothetical protein